VLLTRYFKETEQLSTEDALKKAFSMLEGSNAIVMSDAEHKDKLHCVKSAGPLHVGILKDHQGYIVASEVAVFQNYTNEYIDVKENELLTLDISKDPVIHKDVFKAQSEKIQSEPKPGFSTFLEQEIFEQPEAIARAFNYGSWLICERGYLINLGGLNSHALKLKQIDNLVISACGTSYHAGLFGSILMKELDCFNTV